MATALEEREDGAQLIFHNRTFREHRLERLGPLFDRKQTFFVAISRSALCHNRTLQNAGTPSGGHARLQHRASIILVISSGAAKITEARSPSMPAGMIAGTPLAGPSLLASVMKRKLRSQKCRVFPLAVVTR